MNFKILKKLLILSLITSALTACGGGGGGGGGGGSNPTPPTPSIPIPPSPPITTPPIDVDNSGNDGGEVIKPDKDNPNGNIPTSNNKLERSGAMVIGAKGRGNITLNEGNSLIITDLPGGNSTLGKILDSKGNSKFKIIDDLSGYSIGIYSDGGDVINNGEIILKGNKAIGILGRSGNLTNNKTIHTNNTTLDSVVGMMLLNSSKNDKATNNGIIDLKSSNIAVGIDIRGNGVGTNNGTIIINSSNGIGMSGIGDRSTVINNEVINIYGNGIGMYAGYGSSAKNNDTINIYGSGYGMYADNVSVIENNGTINLSARAQGAMIADGEGSYAINNKNGIINVASGNSLTSDEQVVKGINGGNAKNYGVINFDNNAIINATSGKYIIGTDIDGSYGKVKGKTIEVDGNIGISGEIAKSGYRDSYTLENIFEADSIEFGDNYKVFSESLLYDVEIKKDEDSSNYNGELTRNEKNISDFTQSSYKDSAKVLDKYFSQEEFEKLGEEGKKLISSIDTIDIDKLNSNMRDLTPNLYANNGRIISDLANLFQEEKIENISNIRDTGYSFKVLENYSDIDSRAEISGYENSVTGFIGSVELGEKNYLSLGYSHSNIDFDSDGEGKIDSIYLDISKKSSYQNLKFEYGLGGEYNFHSIDRDMESFSTTGDSDFNSYGIQAYGKISTELEKILTFEPYLTLNLAYYSVDDIEESSDITTIEIEKEKYNSLKTGAGIKISKDYSNFKFFTDFKYSYEFGSMNKELTYGYRGIDEKASLVGDKIERGYFQTLVGMEYSKNSFTIGLNGGKNFGERDNKFVGINLGYRF